MIKVELPDGRILEVAAPDAQTAAAAAKRFMDRERDGPRTRITVRPQRREELAGVSAAEGASAQGEQTLRAGMQGLARAGADVIGFGPDLVNAGVNLGLAGLDAGSQALGGPSLPFRFGSVSEGIAGAVSEAARRLGVNAMDPAAMTPREKLAYNVNQFGTQAAAGAGMLAPLAAPRAAAIATGKATPRMTDALLRPYEGQNIGRTVIGDAGAGAGTGVGVSAAEQYGPKDSVVAHTLGALGGGLAGATATSLVRSPAAMWRRITSGLPDPDIPLDPVTRKPVSRRVADATADFVQGQATNPQTAAARHAERARLAADDGAPAPTAGLGSDDIGLIALERGARLNDPRRFAERDQLIVDHVQDRVTGLRDPEANQAALPAYAQREADARINAAQSREDTAAARQAAVQGIRQEQGAALTAPRGSGVAASQDLHAAVVDRGYIPARTAKNDAFNAIDPQRELQVDADPVLAAAQRVRDDINALGPQGQQLPAEFVQRIEALVPDEGPTVATLGDLVDVRRYLSTAYENARNAGNFQLANNINTLRRAVNEVVDAVPEGAAANEQYRQFAATYRQGEMGRFTRDIDRGRAPPPSQTADRFIQAERPEKAADLQRAIQAAASPEEARQAVRRFLLADLADVAVDSRGMPQPQAIARWRERHAANIDMVPGLRQEIETHIRRSQQGASVADTATSRVRQAREATRRVRSEIDASPLGLLRESDPRNVAQQLLSGQRYGTERIFQDIKRQIAGNPEAERAWRAAVIDVLVDKVTTTNTALTGGREGPVTIAKLQQVFKTHEKALAEVFGPEGMQTLRRAHKMLEPFGNMARRAVTGSQTAENQQAINMLEAAVLGYTGNAVTTGMIMKRLRVAMNLFGLKEHTLPTKVNRLVARMWFDPDLFNHLMTRPVRRDPPGWNARLNELLAAGEGVREATDRE